MLMYTLCRYIRKTWHFAGSFSTASCRATLCTHEPLVVSILYSFRCTLMPGRKDGKDKLPAGMAWIQCVVATWLTCSSTYDLEGTYAKSAVGRNCCTPTGGIASVQQLMKLRAGKDGTNMSCGRDTDTTRVCPLAGGQSTCGLAGMHRTKKGCVNGTAVKKNGAGGAGYMSRRLYGCAAAHACQHGFHLGMHWEY